MKERGRKENEEDWEGRKERKSKEERGRKSKKERKMKTGRRTFSIPYFSSLLH
jgi:hypothetical protein